MQAPAGNEHSRYRIAFRIMSLMELTKTHSYTVTELSDKLDVTTKTIRRMITGLESVGVPFYKDDNGNWRILK